MLLCPILIFENLKQDRFNPSNHLAALLPSFSFFWKPDILSVRKLLGYLSSNLQLAHQDVPFANNLSKRIYLGYIKRVLDLLPCESNQLIMYYLLVRYLLRIQQYPLNNTYNLFTSFWVVIGLIFVILILVILKL